MGIGQIDMEAGGSSSDEMEEEPPPTSSDPVIQWLVNKIVSMEGRMKRVERTVNGFVHRTTRLERNVKDIMDEGDPWIRDVQAYVRGLYVRYFADKPSVLKC